LEDRSVKRARARVSGLVVGAVLACAGCGAGQAASAPPNKYDGGLLGQWQGMTSQNGTPSPTAVALWAQNGTLAGNLVLPGSACSGTLSPTGGASKAPEFTLLPFPGSQCVQGGRVKVSLIATGRVLYEWTSPDGARTDSGYLVHPGA
jgi:hypothetical protein